MATTGGVPCHNEEGRRKRLKIDESVSYFRDARHTRLVSVCFMPPSQSIKMTPVSSPQGKHTDSPMAGAAAAPALAEPLVITQDTAVLQLASHASRTAPVINAGPAAQKFFVGVTAAGTAPTATGALRLTAAAVSADAARLEITSAPQTIAQAQVPQVLLPTNWDSALSPQLHSAARVANIRFTGRRVVAAGGAPAAPVGGPETSVDIASAIVVPLTGPDDNGVIRPQLFFAVQGGPKNQMYRWVTTSARGRGVLKLAPVSNQTAPSGWEAFDVRG